MSGRKVWKIMVMKSLLFFLKDMNQSRLHINHGSFVQVTSCDLRVDNKLFERWNYDIMISLKSFISNFVMIFFLIKTWKETLTTSIALWQFGWLMGEVLITYVYARNLG